jgi:hypothetical protein
VKLRTLHLHVFTGTEGSNPSPSSGESPANLSFRRIEVQGRSREADGDSRFWRQVLEGCQIPRHALANRLVVTAQPLGKPAATTLEQLLVNPRASAAWQFLRRVYASDHQFVGDAAHIDLEIEALHRQTREMPDQTARDGSAANELVGKERMDVKDRIHRRYGSGRPP